jgi:deoxyribonuclease-4
MKKSLNHELLIGAHLSISKGLDDVFRQADELGCTTLQLFTKSGRQWHAKPLTDEEIAVFKAAHKAHNHMPLVAHASYLINIGSPDATLAHKSTAALAQELERCEQLGIHYLVLHPGSHRDTDTESCLERVAHNLTTVLKKVPGSAMILLETMAGQGSTVGSSFEELGAILKKSSAIAPSGLGRDSHDEASSRSRAHHNPRLGICLDTCHVFAAGYDFTTPAGYIKMWHEFDAQIGRHALKIIHMNDSQKPLGSHVDRHCDIGTGAIGNAGFRLIMQDTTLAHIPKVLETPKESLDDDARNLDALRKLAQR